MNVCITFQISQCEQTLHIVIREMIWHIFIIERDELFLLSDIACK